MAERASKRAEVGFGQVAIAPRVDDPIGFAVHNLCGEALIVSFTYDATTPIQTVHVERKQQTKTLPDEPPVTEEGNMPAGTA